MGNNVRLRGLMWISWGYQKLKSCPNAGARLRTRQIELITARTRTLLN